MRDTRRKRRSLMPLAEGLRRVLCRRDVRRDFSRQEPPARTPGGERVETQRYAVRRIQVPPVAARRVRPTLPKLVFMAISPHIEPRTCLRIGKRCSRPSQRAGRR